MEPMLDFLEEQKADIYFLQEVYESSDPLAPPRYHSVKTIQRRLGYPSSSFAPIFTQTIDGYRITSGNAIICKFEIRNTSVHHVMGEFSEWPPGMTDYRTLPNALQIAEVDTPSGLVNVCNLHGVWDLDGDLYSPARQHMSEVVLRVIKNKPNIILAGDTNAKHTNQAMRNIEQVLTSVFGNSLTTTFNMRRKSNPGFATAAVDLMFVSNSFIVKSRRCPDIDVSDHLPLVVELELFGP